MTGNNTYWYTLFRNDVFDENVLQVYAHSTYQDAMDSVVHHNSDKDDHELALQGPYSAREMLELTKSVDTERDKVKADAVIEADAHLSQHYSADYVSEEFRLREGFRFGAEKAAEHYEKYAQAFDQALGVHRGSLSASKETLEQENLVYTTGFASSQDSVERSVAEGLGKGASALIESQSTLESTRSGGYSSEAAFVHDVAHNKPPHVLEWVRRMNDNTPFLSRLNSVSNDRQHSAARTPDNLHKEIAVNHPEVFRSARPDFTAHTQLTDAFDPQKAAKTQGIDTIDKAVNRGFIEAEQLYRSYVNAAEHAAELDSSRPFDHPMLNVRHVNEMFREAAMNQETTLSKGMELFASEELDLTKDVSATRDYGLERTEQLSHQLNKENVLQHERGRGR